MYIKEVKKQNKGYRKVFVSHRLIESYRTDRGPRHRTILNLGKLSLPKDQWKILSDRIEEIVVGQTSLIPPDKNIEQLAGHYADIIIQNALLEKPSTDASKPCQYETVDLYSLKNGRCRTIGAEYVGLSMFKALTLQRNLVVLFD